MSVTRELRIDNALIINLKKEKKKKEGTRTRWRSFNVLTPSPLLHLHLVLPIPSHHYPSPSCSIMHSSSIHFIIFSFERLEQSISRGQALVKRSFEFSQLCQEASETCLSCPSGLLPSRSNLFFILLSHPLFFFFFFFFACFLRAYFLVFFFFSFFLLFFLFYSFFSPSLICPGIQRSRGSRSVAGVSRTLLFSIFSRPIVWNRTCM